MSVRRTLGGRCPALSYVPSARAERCYSGLRGLAVTGRPPCVERAERRRRLPPRPQPLLGSSSGSSLHAKTASIDRARAFVGPFNFDPRSKELNTELGFVIDSPAIAGGIADAVNGRLAARAYRVDLTTTGSLRWTEQVDGKEVCYDYEPRTTFWQRLKLQLLSLLPIEYLL